MEISTRGRGKLRTLMDVAIHQAKGPLSLVEGVDDSDCGSRGENCVARSVWEQVSQAFRGALRKINLAEILRPHAAANRASHYVI